MTEVPDFDWIAGLRAARTFAAVRAITLTEARDIAGADGATFIVRDGDFCCYVDEDAIGPLWRGARFPVTACVSGWAMRNAETVEVPDVHADERASLDMYRSTFVRSLVMAPMGVDDPPGAVGVYWTEFGQRLTVSRLIGLEILAAEAGSAVHRLGRDAAGWAPIVPFDLRSAS